MCGKKTPIVFCTEPVFLIDCNFSNFLNAPLENDDNINLFCILKGIYKKHGGKCTPTLKCSQVISGHTPLVKTGHIIGINSFMLNGKGRDFEMLVSMSNVCQTHSLK